MTITRNNYEEFFMLYADDELSAADRHAVESFVSIHPDLLAELNFFKDSKLDPSDTIKFDNKASLARHEEVSGDVNTTNYESFFVLYADKELNTQQQKEVETFLILHPEYQAAFDLLQQVKLSPNTALIFENKQALYRHEKERRVVPFRWWAGAAAAAILLCVSGLFLMNRRPAAQVAMQAKPALHAKPMVSPVTAPAPVIAKTKDASAEETKTTDTGVEAARQKNTSQEPAEAIAQVAKKNATVVPETVQKVNTTVQPDNATPDKTSGVADVASNHVATDVSDVATTAKSSNVKATALNKTQTPVIDQAVIILHPDETNKDISYASSTNENVEVLNTSVNTKSSLRGFLRKASRLIAKKTNSDDEDNGRKTILIGGFEIAVR